MILSDEEVANVAEELRDGGPAVVPPNTDLHDLALRLQPHYAGYGKLELSADSAELETVLTLEPRE